MVNDHGCHGKADATKGRAVLMLFACLFFAAALGDLGWWLLGRDESRSLREYAGMVVFMGIGVFNWWAVNKYWT